MTWWCWLHEVPDDSKCGIGNTTVLMTVNVGLVTWRQKYMQEEYPTCAEQRKLCCLTSATFGNKLYGGIQHQIECILFTYIQADVSTYLKKKKGNWQLTTACRRQANIIKSTLDRRDHDTSLWARRSFVMLIKAATRHKSPGLDSCVWQTLSHFRSTWPLSRSLHYK